MSHHDPHPPDLHDDAELVAQLGRALDDLDPVPDDALVAARAAFDLGRADDALADLVFDSLLDDSRVAMRHDGAVVRSLGFVAQGYRIDIELIDDDAALLGHLEPAQAAHVELETVDGRRDMEVDDLGRFHFSAARGSLRLRLHIAAGPVVVTPWITW